MDNPLTLWERRQAPLTMSNFVPLGVPIRLFFPLYLKEKNNYAVYVEYMPTFPGLFRSLDVTAFPLSVFVSGLVVLCSLISTWVHLGIGCWNMIVSTIGGCQFLMPHTALMSLTPSVRLSWQWITGSILTHIFPLWGERGSRREPWLNSDTIKMETENCLALGVAWDQTWIASVGCLTAETPPVWIGETSVLKLTYRWSPGAWASKVKGKSVCQFPQSLDRALSLSF